MLPDLPHRDVPTTLKLSVPGGLEVDVAPFGATVVRLRAPDRCGVLGDVLLGFEHTERYHAPHPYLGGTVGRYANRIGRGRLTLDGHGVQLSRNLAPHHLHGGRVGFDRVLWSVGEAQHAPHPGVSLHYVAADGEEGYPGRLEVQVHYALVDALTLEVAYVARTDRATVVNMTNHAYFNLDDGGATSALGHALELHAGHYTPVDAEGIPTGAIAPVVGTPLDFTRARRLEQGLAQGLAGYDHNFVVDGWDGSLRSVATLRAARSGRVLEVWTTQPGLQVYGGGGLDATLRGHGGVAYGPGHGLCLETQHFPDSPNHAHFPSTVLRPGETYVERTQWRLGVA
ncbi:MAG: aldose epimerase family protein [Myxococcota bacterium]